MPMQSINGTPPTQRWVPQAEPLDLNEPIGLLCDPNEGDRPLDIHVEDLDPTVQHRIESWPEAVEILRLAADALYTGGDMHLAHSRVADWLAENATEESQ